MSKNKKLPLKPIPVRFGPRDFYRYAELIEALQKVPLGSRSAAAKELMLQGLKAGGLPEHFIAETTVEDDDKNKKKDKKPIKPIDGLDDMI